MRDFKDLKIAVAGTGYVGLSIATLLSQHHKVMAVDIVPEKVELINSKKSPIQDEYIEKYLAEKELNLTATLDAKEAYSDADFVVIAAPTNYDSKKNFFDTSAVEAVIKLVIEYNPEAIMVIKSKLDMVAAKKKIEKSLKNDYYMQNREWPYKNVKRRIIAEEYMVDESGYELKDYKIFAFDGEAKAMFIASDRTNPNKETKFDFFDMDFNHLPFTNGHPNSKEWDKIKRPKGLDEMKKYAEILSKGLPEARIDFYDINGKVYFGEITFFHWSGFERFEPAEWDKKFGSWITLPTK